MAFVTLLLLGGAWSIRRDADVKAKLGRYRLASKTTKNPINDIELKEDNQWLLHARNGGMKGTYAIAGDEVTFSGKDIPTLTGRFTEGGFTLNTKTPNAVRPLYKKIP